MNPILRAHFLACFIALSAAMSAPQLAWAQDAASVETARQRFKEGVQLYDQRQYEKARAAFLQSYTLKPHPATLLNLAQSELRAGHHADAATHFAQYLREPTVSDAERQEVEIGFAAARSKVGEVTLTVDLDGATVLVDGQERGKSPLPDPLYLTPGSHTIEARSGNQAGTTTVNAAAGAAARADIQLANAAAPTAGAAPPVDSDAPASETGASESFQADTGGKKPFFQWFFSKPLAIVGGIVAVVGLGGGVTFAVLAKRDFDTAEDVKAELLDQKALDGFADLPCNLSPTTRMQLGTKAADYDNACGIYDQNVSDAESKRTIAIVGFAVGGAAAVGTVIYYLVDPGAREGDQGSASRPRTAIAPFFTPEAQGVTVIGRF